MEQHPDRATTCGRGMHSARLAFLFLQRRIGADALAWTGGLISAVLLRYDFHAGRVGWAGFALLATGDHPSFDIVLPDLSTETVGRLQAAFDPPEPNPGRG